MATKSTEPAAEPTSGTATANKYELVYVYDTKSTNKLAYPVPRTWLDGRFPHLKEQPSKKAGN